jgi:hypothetical protein
LAPTFNCRKQLFVTKAETFFPPNYQLFLSKNNNNNILRRKFSDPISSFFHQTNLLAKGVNFDLSFKYLSRKVRK